VRGESPLTAELEYSPLFIRKDYNMPASKAQLEANKRYRKNNVKNITVAFYPADVDILAYLDSKGGRSSYIKKLIREDMEKA
jgi:hypothetical protein